MTGAPRSPARSQTPDNAQAPSLARTLLACPTPICWEEGGEGRPPVEVPLPEGLPELDGR
jgi:hypothetical protein